MVRRIDIELLLLKTKCELEGHDFETREYVSKDGHRHRQTTCHTEMMIWDVDLDIVVRITEESDG